MRCRLAWIAAAVVLAGCSAQPAATALPTPPPPATLTRVPTLPVPTRTSPPPTAAATLAPPTDVSLFAEVTADDWRLGPDEAPVSIVTYSDFQCLMCGEVAAALTRLHAEFPDDVRLVFRHFPLPQHDKAALAALAAEAAGQQGQFWALHDLLFERQAEWQNMTPEGFRLRLLEYAAELALDANQFAADLEDEALQAQVQSAADTANSIPLPGAPFLLFNGEPVQDERMLTFWALDTLVRLEILKQRQYAERPPEIINPFAAYTATIQTSKGNIIVALFAERAPLTVNNFVFLAREGWYDGVIFHRVIPGFAAQAGDPSGTGYGGPGYFIPDEIVPELRFDGPGWVGMANSGPDTNGSQFFITLGPTPDLDGKYTLFGQVLEGMDVARRLAPRDPNATEEPPPGDSIITITIEEQA
jgi:cyclophilin family peptidyl-prolyl cis-trans isomerase/protein-disulfide isomerase